MHISITVTFSILFGSMCGMIGQESHTHGLRSQQRTAIPKLKCSLIGHNSERAVLSVWLRKHASVRHRFPCDSPDVGVLASLVVFAPTTIIGILFKHTRPRAFDGKHFDKYTSDDLDNM